jgi:hypothetical protein
MFCSVAVHVEAGTISFFDGTFANANWNNTKILDPSGTGSFTAFQVASGGNPGAFQETILNFNPPAIDVSHLNPTFTYDPSTQGAIASINFNYDSIEFSPLQGIEVVYSPLLFQNGTYYTGVFDNVNQSVWTNFAHNGLTASDFVRDFDGLTLPGSGPAIPDFSSTGGPIEFGFATGNTAPCFIPCSTTISGIDNLSFTLNTVQPTIPEPASLALLATGIVGIGIMSCRRRKAA